MPLPLPLPELLLELLLPPLPLPLPELLLFELLELLLFELLELLVLDPPSSRPQNTASSFICRRVKTSPREKGIRCVCEQGRRGIKTKHTCTYMSMGMDVSESSRFNSTQLDWFSTEKVAYLLTHQFHICSLTSSVLTRSAVARRRGSALATTATEATTTAREKNRWAIILFEMDVLLCESGFVFDCLLLSEENERRHSEVKWI